MTTERKTSVRTALLILCLAVVALSETACDNAEAKAQMTYLQLAIGYALLVIMLFLGGAILVYLWRGKIDLSQLLGEHGGGASMSRFQLLVFTFVIGFSFFYIVAATGKFPDPIPSQVLMLLGISATTYGVSKGIQGAGGLASKGGSDGEAGNGADGQGEVAGKVKDK